ncbi:hypothetical protein C8F04DRAFT_1192491 [Mycena alexandri]|uniref:MIT domain-containing protein n=1 Tax=Mycena alexandri TaxID=1745969 RepID=A0AAD6WRH2_9AGAR|nr:hypothetical protein C8F04DRAFT_1192491 [Mycena alexandri]
MSSQTLRPSETLHQTLTRALGAAQVAVQLDEADQDTMSIVEAYQRSISLLDDVIRRGEHLPAHEAERLRGVCERYRERVQVLLLSRSVPIAQRSTDTLITSSKLWKFPGQARKARRWTVARLKVLGGCMSSSSIIL